MVISVKLNNFVSKLYVHVESIYKVSQHHPPTPKGIDSTFTTTAITSYIIKNQINDTRRSFYTCIANK